MIKNKRTFIQGKHLTEEKMPANFFPAEIKKIGKVTYIDLTKPGAYLPAEMYHPEDDIYED